MKHTALISIFLTASMHVHACAFSQAHYTYSGRPHVSAVFRETENLKGWKTQRYIDISVNTLHVYLLFDRGAARKLNLISSPDPTISPPSADGGERPYGEMTYIAWNRHNVVDEAIPKSPPDFFIIPELSENLAHKGSNPTNIGMGIFTLSCNK